MFEIIFLTFSKLHRFCRVRRLTHSAIRFLYQSSFASRPILRQAAFKLLHFAFHASFTVKSIPPCMGVRSSSNLCSPCFTCLSGFAHPRATCSPGKRFSGPFSTSVLSVAMAIPLRTIGQPALPVCPKIPNDGEKCRLGMRTK